MVRHGSQFILVCTVLLAGCQNFQSEPSIVGQDLGLAEPDSLIQFPSAVAEYPPEAPTQTTESKPRHSDVKQAAARIRPAEQTVQLAEFEAETASGSSLATALDQARAAMANATSQRSTEALNRARALYEQVLAVSPTHAEAHHRLAVMADNDADFEVAEQHYRKALAATPHDADLISDIGFSYQLQQRPGVARSFFERALLLQPGHQQAANNLGRLHAEAGDYEEAVRLFHLGSTAENAQLLIAHFFPNRRPSGETATSVRGSVGGPLDAARPTTKSADTQLPQYEPALMASQVQSDDLVEQQAQAARKAIADAEQKIHAELIGTEPTSRTRVVSLRQQPMANTTSQVSAAEELPAPTITGEPVESPPRPMGLNETTPIGLASNRTAHSVAVVSPPAVARDASPPGPPQYPGAIVIDPEQISGRNEIPSQSRGPVTLPPWTGRKSITESDFTPAIKPQSGAAFGRELPHPSQQTTSDLPMITPKQE